MTTSINIFRLYIANDPGCTVSEMYLSKVHLLFRLTLLLLLIYFNDLRLNYLDDDSRLGYKNKNQRSDYLRQKREEVVSSKKKKKRGESEETNAQDLK